MSLFRGTLQLEDQGLENNKYLIWKQVGHMLAAVDIFNVVSFWNTRTGKLIYKTILSDDKKIQDAEKFWNPNYAKVRSPTDPSEQFDCLTQMIRTGSSDYSQDYYRLRLIKFDFLDSPQKAF